MLIRPILLNDFRSSTTAVCLCHFFQSFVLLSGVVFDPCSTIVEKLKNTPCNLIAVKYA